MNIKKTFYILCLLLVIIIAVTGCRSSQPEIEEGEISFLVSVDFDMDEEVFLAIGWIYEELANEKIYFADAEIKINEIELSWVKDFSWYRADDLDLEPNEEVTIKLSHSKVGNLEETLVIPLPVTGLTVEPDLDQWLDDDIDAILSWDDIGADIYYVDIYIHNEDNKYVDSYTIVRTPEDTSYNLKNIRDRLFEKYEEGYYVTIYVIPQNSHRFPNLKGIFIASSYSTNVITNK